MITLGILVYYIIYYYLCVSLTVRGGCLGACGYAVGSVVHNFHTVALGTVEVSFLVTAETQAWCDADGTVVSFTDLQISQNRRSSATTAHLRPLCADATELWKQY
jgi:hypothetical protein